MKISKTVLLIDDDEDEHVWFKEALDIYDNTIACLSAYDCSQALHILKETHPDFIFSDFNMPGYNGLECLQRIKCIPALKDIPVYIYSASKATKEERSKALELGAEEWLYKPANLNEYKLLFKKVFENQSSSF